MPRRGSHAMQPRNSFFGEGKKKPAAEPTRITKEVKRILAREAEAEKPIAIFRTHFTPTSNQILAFSDERCRRHLPASYIDQIWDMRHPTDPTLRGLPGGDYVLNGTLAVHSPAKVFEESEAGDGPAQIRERRVLRGLQLAGTGAAAASMLAGSKAAAVPQGVAGCMAWSDPPPLPRLPTVAATSSASKPLSVAALAAGDAGGAGAEGVRAASSLAALGLPAPGGMHSTYRRVHSSMAHALEPKARRTPGQYQDQMGAALQLPAERQQGTAAGGGAGRASANIFFTANAPLSSGARLNAAPAAGGGPSLAHSPTRAACTFAAPVPTPLSLVQASYTVGNAVPQLPQGLQATAAFRMLKREDEVAARAAQRLRDEEFRNKRAGRRETRWYDDE